MKKHKTLCVEDFRKRNEELERGLTSQSKYNVEFTEARFHGLMNTPEGKALGPIMPFANGGSALAAIEGTSPYTSIVKYQRERLRLTTEIVDEGKQFIYDWGHFFETAVGKMGIQILSKRIGKNLIYLPCEFGYLNTKYPHFLAHPDGFVIDLDKNEIVALAEVKTTSTWSGNWKDYYSQDKWPPEYYPQMQGYTWVVNQKYPGIKSCFMIAWGGSRSESAFRIIECKLDRKYAEGILAKSEKFVDDTVKGIRYDISDIQNPALAEKEFAEMYPTAREDASLIDLGEKFDETFEELAELFDRQEELAAEVKKAEEEFKKSVADKAKELKSIEGKIRKKSATFLTEIKDNNGGYFTDEAGTRWEAIVERKYSLDKEVKAWAAENYAEAWEAITSQKTTASIKVSRNRKKEESDEETA